MIAVIYANDRLDIHGRRHGTLRDSVTRRYAWGWTVIPKHVTQTP